MRYLDIEILRYCDIGILRLLGLSASLLVGGTPQVLVKKEKMPKNIFLKKGPPPHKKITKSRRKLRQCLSFLLVLTLAKLNNTVHMYSVQLHLLVEYVRPLVLT